MKSNYKIIIVTSIAALLGSALFLFIFYQKDDASIFNYLPYIFGSVFFLSGSYLFLISFGIYKPKYKTEEQQLKVDDLMNRRAKFWKVGSIIMIAYGLYNLISHNPNIYKLDSQVDDNKWTNTDKQEFVKNCTEKMGETAKQYPLLVADYCTCLIDNTMKNMTKKQYLEDLELVKKEQDKKFNLLFQGCKVNINRRIDSADKK